MSEPLPIRMLALDLDGTVLGPDRKPHPETAAAIHEALAAGLAVVLASGRMPLSIRRVAGELGISPAVVGLNGALVETETGERLHTGTVGQAAQDAVVDYAYATRVHLSVYDETGVSYAFDSEWGRRYAERVGGISPSVLPEAELRAMAAYKLLFADDPEAIVRHRAAIAPSLSEDDATITESEPDYLEFLPPGVSKAGGLELLARRAGIVPAQVAAIGDYLNDVEMLTYAGLSGAMGNAHPEVKRVAGVVVGTNADGGVAEFIRSYVLQR